MGSQTGDSQEPGTTRFSAETTQDAVVFEADVVYKPAPHTDAGPDRPAWRVRFELASDPSIVFGLDINGEIVLGRGLPSAPDYIDLGEYEASQMGVSRRHAMLRPTGNKLYVIDLGSTNGTYRNGHSIGVKTPYGLNNGDTLTLGRLQFVVRIIKRPPSSTTTLHMKADLADALAQTAKAITSQLELDAVLNQVAETAMALLGAAEVGVWLVDQETGELFLEVERGMQEASVKHARLPVSGASLAGQVVKTGKPIRANREPGGEQIKIKTDYLVESLLFVPISLGGETIGTISAAQHEPGKQFSERTEKLLCSIADFAAIAVQNSRTYKFTDEALARRVKELAALNDLSHAVSSSLDLKTVHDVLMQKVHKHWQIEAAALWLVDRKSDTLYGFSADVKDDSEHAQAHFKIGRGIVGKVAELGEPLFANDAQGSSAYDAKIDTTNGIDAQNMACVPLFVGGEVAAVLALFNKQDEKFTDQDIDRLQAFANPMATAIENARLFAQTQRERATVLATANSISQPLIILSEDGEVVISNEAANRIFETSLSQVFNGLSQGVGQTVEIEVGDQTYITTSQHSPGVGTIIVMQDITYVKQLEKTRTDFVHALSHDLKSPLASIQGWTHLLHSHGELNEQSTKFVDQIGMAVERVLDMVDQLLDTALVEITSKTSDEPCDLAALVTNAIDDLRGSALAKSIDVEFKQMGEPYNIRGDCQRLYRCVLNLIDNALKYSPEESSVAVGLTYWGELITIQVRDDGPGIPQEDIPRIFEKYYRGQQAHGEVTGAGLGLASVKNIVEAHGGTVAVKNVAGHGAEFTITLPLGPAM